MTKLWKNSIMQSFYGDDTTMDTNRCEISIGDGRISVTYEYEPAKFQIYEGSEMGDGHYNLKEQGGDGRASLHCFPDGRILDGWWTEDSGEGMWRIHLIE
jgi:hypothetical protein